MTDYPTKTIAALDEANALSLTDLALLFSDGGTKRATLALLQEALAVSPVLTGTPTAPTAPLGTNTNQIATMAAVHAAVSELLSGAPGALDTLNELAAALGDDANFASTVTAALAARLRFDAAQALTTGQQAQALDNLGIGVPGWVHIETQIVTAAVSAVDFSLMPEFDDYQLVISAVKASTDATLCLRINNGAGLVSGANTYDQFGRVIRPGGADVTVAGNTSLLELFGPLRTTFGILQAAGSVTFWKGSASDRFLMQAAMSGDDTTVPGPSLQFRSGNLVVSGAATAIRLFMSTGNIISGRFTLLGLRK